MMTGNYKRRFVTCEEEDRISNLPEDLIQSILERVPFEYAVRTSTLSKKWTYRWTTMKYIILDKHFSNKFAKNGAFGRNGLLRIISQILILHEGPISKFQLCLPNMSLDSFQEVDQWMLLLSRKHVRELTFINLDRCYKLPRYVFSCLELIELQLGNCIFKPPLEFEGFLNLERLALKRVDFRSNLCGNQINLPQLKKLYLVMCTNVYNFNIKATKLEQLFLSCCPDAKFLRLFNNCPCLTEMCMEFFIPIRRSVRIERMTLAMMLSHLPKTERLYIDGLSFKVVIEENIPKWLPRAVNSLKHLWLLNYQFGDLDQLEGALCLLRSAPNLEHLSVKSYNTNSRLLRYDVGPTIDHLEAPNCLDCTLNRLHTVDICSFEGSRPELLFIKLLLAHSPYLEKCTIRLCGVSDAQKRIDILKDFIQFPRASPKAQMFLNS